LPNTFPADDVDTAAAAAALTRLIQQHSTVITTKDRNKIIASLFSPHYIDK